MRRGRGDGERDDGPRPAAGPLRRRPPRGAGGAGRPCRVLGADARVLLADADMTVYIDLSVICGPMARPVHARDAGTNPTLVLEVLSPSTAARDRGGKRRAYMRAPTVQHIVFVASDRVEVERCIRVDNRACEVRAAGPSAACGLPAMGMSVEVDALYEDAGLRGGLLGA